MNFQACLAFTLQFEGGYSVDPHDPGNYTSGKIGKGILKGTKKGIAASSHPNLDIKNLTDDEIAQIYKREYWDAVKGDTLPAGVDMAVFDYGVQSGPGRANAAYAKYKGGNINSTIKGICASRLSFMQGLAIWKSMGKGLASRVSKCEAAALKMAMTAANVPTSDQTLILKKEATQSQNKAAVSRAGAAVSGGATVTIIPVSGSHGWTLIAICLILGIAALAAIVRSRVQMERANVMAAGG